MAVNDAWGHAPSSERPDQGENLAMSGTTGTPGELVPEIGWYDNEEIYYDYSTGDFISTAPPNAQIGHFTQMVWDETTTIGCGESQIRRGNWNYTYSVCRYSPPGNWWGQYT